MAANYEFDDYILNLEAPELAAEFTGEEEFGRRRRWPVRSFSPRRSPAGRRPQRARRPALWLAQWPAQGLAQSAAASANLDAPDSSAAGEYVRWVQTMLNQVLRLQLPVDGVMSVQVRSAIRSFQAKNGLPVTGIVGPDTEQALIALRDGQTSGAWATQVVDAGMIPPHSADNTPSKSGTVESAMPVTPTLATEFDSEWEFLNEERENRYVAPSTSRTHQVKSNLKHQLFTAISGGFVAGRNMPRRAARSELMFEPEPLSFQFEYPEGMESEDLTIIRQCDTAGLKAIPLLEPRIVACGSTTVPSRRVRWLLDHSRNENAPNWVKRLQGDISNVVQQVKVTIEIFRIIPIGAYDLTVTKEFRRYLDAKRILYAGGVTDLGSRGSLEKDLNVSLLSLYQQAGVNKALSNSEYWSYRVLVYATFPDSVKDHLRPEGVYLLDKFRFGGWNLLPGHIKMLRNLARDIYEAAFYSNRMVKRIHIRGHTDERGTGDFNYRLGEKRAKSVEQQLRKTLKAQAIAKNLPSSWFVALEKLEISVGSLGEDEPVSKTVHELNRRVEVFVEYTTAIITPPVQLDEITSRLRKLLPNQRIIDADAAQRLLCIVSKMKPGVDDRFFWAQAVLNIDNANKPLDPVNASRIRYDLVNPAFFGPNVGDEQLVRNAKRLLDDVIIAGIQKLRQLINYYSGAPALGALVTGRGLRGLDEWFQKQLKDPNSIYHCYKDF